MKIGKLLMIAMTICCLLIMSSMQVTALEKSETLEDGAEDVVGINFFDYTEEIVTENEYIKVDNIDIRKVEYEITNETIEFTIEVAGVIEDRGSIDQLLGTGDMDDLDSFNVDVISYTFYLTTDENTYTFTYINNSCLYNDLYSENYTPLPESDFSTNNNILTVSFNFDTSNETFDNAYTETGYTRMILDESILNSEDLYDLDSLGIVVLMDKAPNGPLAIEYAGADTNLAEVGTAVNFSSLVVDGYPPHEFRWDFGDGGTSSKPNPIHIYDEIGDYNYTLTVIDAEGTSEGLSGSIEIVKGDDTNDTPGFEFIIAIMAIGFIFLLKRKR